MGNLHTVGHIFNPLITNDALWRLTLGSYMLSVGAIRFEGKFCASKKGGIGGGEFQHRVAALAGCRTNESMGVVKVINYLRMWQRSFCIPMGHSLYTV